MKPELKEKLVSIINEVLKELEAGKTLDQIEEKLDLTYGIKFADDLKVIIYATLLKL